MAAWLQRLHGELLLMAGQDETKIVASFHDARTAARRQQAKSWEPWAAMSLSRLWQ
jgi:predicted ATPase